MLDRVESNKPLYELIMLDYSMPVLDGPSAAKKIVELVTSKGLKKPFICCVTAYGDDAHIKVANESGMALVMNKPLFKANIQLLLTRAGVL